MMFNPRDFAFDIGQTVQIVPIGQTARILARGHGPIASLHLYEVQLTDGRGCRVYEHDIAPTAHAVPLLRVIEGGLA